MKPQDFKDADAIASCYDESAEKYGWYAPEVLFGLVYDRLGPGERLLDLGVGTGLSAVPFKKAGLQIYGVDGSEKMLEFCASRGIAIELKQYDIRSTPLPFADNQFDHIVACGVFHLIADLDDIFSEAARLVGKSGTFVFTTEELRPDGADGAILDNDGVLEMKNETSGIVSYLHSHDLVENMLSRSGFTTTKTLEFVAYRKTEWADERTFRAYVSVKNETP